MIITLTPLTKSQWKDVLSVAKWVVIAVACAAALAYWDRGTKYLENIAPWLATPAAINLIGVVVKQVLTEEQQAAEAHLPQSVEQPVQQVEQAVASQG